MLRTGLYALGTALTAIGINAGDTVADLDSVVLTHGGAVAQPHASEGAGGDTAVKLDSGGAGADPLVFHPVGGVVVGTHAVDQSGFIFYLAGGDAEKLGGSRGHRGAARGA